MNTASEHWLTAQMAVSAQRLASFSPEFLSPGRRFLRDTAERWVAGEESFMPVGAQEQFAPGLRVVPTKTDKHRADSQQQLPLLGAITDS